MDISTLVKRARLQNITGRATDLDRLREMLDGTYEPPNGFITPQFTPGTSRHAAYTRAVRTTTSAVPVIINKSLAGLDFGNITWSDAETGANRADDQVAALDLAGLARSLATEYRLTGAAAAMASTPRTDAGFGDPIITALTGVNLPYTDPRNPGSVTGWYRAVQHLDEGGHLVWWVEVYDFVRDDATVHRVWERLSDPTLLGTSPDQEYESTARPRFALYGLQADGLPMSAVLANEGRIMGLYATELRLATTEELSAFPMLVTRGGVEVKQVGPAEVISADVDADAKWLDPGSLQELREQARMKRDLVREAFNLPGGSLGGQTPSGEALQEANRGFMQETRAIADAVSGVLSEVVSDYLELHNLAPVRAQLPVDRSYTTASLLGVVEKGAELEAVPKGVTARMFQQFLGSHYSDEELEEFLAEPEPSSAPAFAPPEPTPPEPEETRS